VNRLFPFAPLALTAVALLAACSQQDTPAPAAPQQQATAPAAPAAAPPAAPAQVPPGHPPVAGRQAPGQASAITGANIGSVVSVQQAGGYTYLEVDSQGKRLWMASSPVRVNVGDKVRWGGGAVMRNFTSKSLGRTFDELLFVSSVQPADAPVAAPLRPPAAGSWFAEGSGAGRAPTAANANRGEVVSMTLSGGYSFLEIDSGGTRQWFAAQSAPVKVGDTVTWQGGAVMSNFNSKSLNRTFEKIVFVGAVNPVN